MKILKMVKIMEIYKNIDLKQSGQKMKWLLRQAGYDVKTVQHYLHLSCPQPIYRWFNGQILPSVDHLYMLSKLLGVHMEEFLVEKRTLTKDKPTGFSAVYLQKTSQACIWKRILIYSAALADSRRSIK